MVESAVDPTRSQNMTVSCLRSPEERSLCCLNTRPRRTLVFQFRDRIEDPLSWAKRQAKFLQVRFRQYEKRLQVNLILGKNFLKLREAIRASHSPRDSAIATPFGLSPSMPLPAKDRMRL